MTTKDLFNLTNGPGKLTKAFEIGRNLNGADLAGNEIYISKSVPAKRDFVILKSKRIGITKNTEKLYRFYLKNNKFVSRAPRKLFI